MLCIFSNNIICSSLSFVQFNVCFLNNIKLHFQSSKTKNDVPQHLVPNFLINIVIISLMLWASQVALVVKNLPANAGGYI